MTSPSNDSNGSRNSSEPAAEMLYPDEYFPHPRKMDLHTVNRLYHMLLFGSNASTSRFVRLALSGRFSVKEDDPPSIDTLVEIGNLNSRAPRLDHESGVVVTGDWDSLIGQSHTFPYAKPFSIFAVPPFKETLTKNNHVTGLAYNDRGQSLEVPLHTIPNFAIGKADLRGVTRIMLPNLYQRLEENKITQELLEFSWQAMRSAYRIIAPERIGYLPLSYKLAYRQQQGARGQLHLSTYDVPPEFQQRLAERYLHFLALLHDDFRGAYFIHELRGTKASTFHHLDDEHFRRNQLARYTDTFRPDALNDPTSRWDIDVAIEVSLPGHVIHIAECSHAKLLRWLLPSLDQPSNLALRQNSRFLVDHAASLRDLAGFRCETKRRGERDFVSYLNVYPTEKALHYQLHEGGLYRRRSPSDLLPNRINAFIADLTKVASLYSTAAGNAESRGSPASARVEIRVPIEKSLVKLANVPSDILRDCFVAIPSKDWWEFKYYKILAIKYVAEHLQLAAADHRVMKPSLLLGAWIVHHYNALQRRPQSTEAHSEMQACVSAWQPNDWDDPDQGKHPVLYDRGVFYASDIVMSDDCWRLPVTRLPSSEDIAGYYQSADFSSLMGIFIGGLTRAPANSGMIRRVANRKRKMTDVIHLTDRNIRDEFSLPDLKLRNRGLDLRVRPTPKGLDVDNRLPDIEEDFTRQMDNNDPDDPDAICNRMLANFAYNIFQRSPNKKSVNDPAHVLIPPNTFARLSCTIFKTVDLTRVFFAVYARECTTDAWNLIFDRYFPPHGAILPSTGIQNWPTLPYYQQWAHLRARLDREDVETVRREIKREFDTFVWVPHAYTDRVWCTKTSGLNQTLWTRHPPRPPASAPHIALNPRFRHLWKNLRVGSAPTPAGAAPSDDAQPGRSRQNSIANNPREDSTVEEVPRISLNRENRFPIVNREPSEELEYVDWNVPRPSRLRSPSRMFGTPSVGRGKRRRMNIGTSWYRDEEEGRDDRVRQDIEALREEVEESSEPDLSS